MTRTHSFRCQFGFHWYDKASSDEYGRVWCARCRTREPIHYRVLNDIEKQGREMIRPKTRKQRSWK